MNDALRARVLDLMSRHGIGYFDYEGADGRLTLHADRPGEHPPILARLPGIFLTRHPAEREAQAWPRHVVAGEIVGWLKVGPLLEPVRTTEDGVLSRPRLDEGTLASFGDRLF